MFANAIIKFNESETSTAIGCDNVTDSRKLDLILEKIGSLDCKISTLDRRMDSFETRMDSLETKMDSLDNKVVALDNKVNSLDTKTNSLESNLKEIKSHVRHTDLILENEIRINIQRVARTSESVTHFA